MKSTGRRLAVAALAVAAGCGAEVGAPAAGAPDAAIADSSAPPNPRRRPGGDQCPTGSLWSTASAACVPFAPTGCADLGIAGVAQCTPRWCFDWQDADGAGCSSASPGCMPIGRACSEDEDGKGVGCLAGTWPDPRAAAGGCVHAGATALTTEFDPAAPPTPTWGETATQAPAFLAGGCPAGEVPAPKGGCTAAGVDWVCPPGTVADGSGALPPCVPDPADCGTGPWGPDGPVPGALYVQYGAATGGTGSEAKPFSTIAGAVAAAKVNQLVLIGAGTYAEGVVASKPIALRGKCAAQTRIAPPAGKPGVISTANDKVVLWRLSIQGGENGVRVQGGKLAVERVWIDGSKGGGVRIEAKGSTALLRDTWIGHVASNAAGDFGDGVALAPGTGLAVERLRIAHVRNFGLGAPGAVVQGSDLVVDHVDPTAGGQFGIGIAAAENAKVTLERVWVHAARDAGVFVGQAGAGKGSTWAVRSLRISDSGQAKHPTRGMGLECTGPATVDVRGARLHDNGATGLAVLKGCSATLAGAVVWDTRGTPAGKEGFGAAGQTGGQLRVVASFFAANRGSALLARGQGSQLLADHVVVRDTLPLHDSGNLGMAVTAYEGARAVVRGAALVGNHMSALVAGQGAQLFAAGVRIHITRPEVATAGFGHAVFALTGGRAHLQGSFLSENGEATAMVDGPDTLATFAGCRLSNTQLRPDTQRFGMGLAVSGGASAAVVASRLVGHHTAAVQVTGGQATLSHCAVLATLAAGGPGDGIAVAGGVLTLERTAIAGCARTGLLLSGAGTKATVSHSAVFDNQYGVVRMGDASLKASDAAWFANKSQDEAVDNGLSVPEPPVVGSLSL
ncbi:MAG: hypothetical protein FJ100_16430 [Deltaproteobacteria bacterium]|nr:hypothetical protein [Deltaproteobacteria bacterium]